MSEHRLCVSMGTVVSREVGNFQGASGHVGGKSCLPAQQDGGHALARERRMVNTTRVAVGCFREAVSGGDFCLISFSLAIHVCDESNTNNAVQSDAGRLLLLHWCQGSTRH
jgi:hypothetical protein